MTSTILREWIEIVSELLDPESLKVRARLANAIEDARAEFNTARTRENLAAFHAAANALDAFDAEHDKPAPVAASDDDYRGEHQAPTHESGAPLYNLCANGIYPKDFYQGRAHEYGGGEDMRAIGTVLAFHNRPNTSLKIYRTVPQDVKAGINVGDWVAIERRYAVEHGRSHLQGPYRLMSKTVFARDVFTAGDSLQEWGYDPQPRVARTRPAPTSDPE